MYMRDGLHLSAKGAAVFADELSTAVDSGNGSITICLVALFKLEAQRVCFEAPQTGKEATSTHKPVTQCPENISEAGYNYVCSSDRSRCNKNTELNIQSINGSFCLEQTMVFVVVSSVVHIALLLCTSLTYLPTDGSFECVGTCTIRRDLHIAPQWLQPAPRSPAL